MEDNAIEALTSQLMPMATLITPNLSEAEVLTGKRITTIPEMEIAAKELLGFGSQAVLVATYLALGEPLDEAVRKAKAYVYEGILNGKDVHIGEGHGSLNHFFSPVAMRVNEGFD